MASATGKLAPYAPLTNVVGLIRRRRDRGLPEILGADKLTQIGIPEGNVSRTLQAMKFLGLIDEEYRQTQLFNRLANAKESEYAPFLADIIKSAYQDVFTVIGDIFNVATIQDHELVDAFRGYQPDTQRSRMVILFKGLCQEAGLIAGGPPETRIRTRSSIPNKAATASSNGSKKAQPKSDHPYRPGHYQKSPEPNDQPTSSDRLVSMGSTPEAVILQGLLNQLPFVEKKWIQPRRDKWIQAMTATVDLLFELADPETGIGEDMYDA